MPQAYSPRWISLLLLSILFMQTGCGQEAQPTTFVEARKTFHTTLLRHNKIGEVADVPPAGVLELVSYPAPLGANAAYISPRPKSAKRFPAIIWLVGGFSNSISALAWSPGPRANDQSASGFRDHEIVMMYPALRGGNTNPGCLETFAGEVDDVIAATKYLASLDYVDPNRIFLGGHSTGGTLALLVAAAAGEQYRAVFALGPVDDVRGYGADVLPFDLTNMEEAKIRAPILWLKDISCPTYVYEGTTSPSNISSLRTLQRGNSNPLIHFVSIEGKTHFSIIAPLIEQLAQSISADTAQGARFELKQEGTERQIK